MMNLDILDDAPPAPAAPALESKPAAKKTRAAAAIYPVMLADGRRLVSAKHYGQAPFLFRCTANPSAPFLSVDSRWEAREMDDHPDYERVDADGVLIVSDEVLDDENADNPIPFHPARR